MLFSEFTGCTMMLSISLQFIFGRQQRCKYLTTFIAMNCFFALKTLRVVVEKMVPLIER